ASGALLSAGTHTLSALFTPADGANYATGTVTTLLHVQDRPPVLVNPGDQTNSDGSPYAYAVLVDGPSMYWRLGDASGTTLADSAGTDPATRFGGVTLAQPGPLADGNFAARFDGASGYLRAANPAASLAGDLTIELWVNAASSGRQTLISKGYLYEFELT